MNDEQPLLDAIRESPDDDELRRVYADLLEEHGDARAGLIRLQLAGHSGRRLLEENLKTFAGELAPWANVDSFNRGLVESVTMTPAAFVEHGERIFSKYPLQRLTVNVSELTEAQLLELVEAPGMSRVRVLQLEHVGVATRLRRPLAALGKGRHFKSLRRLKFVACGYDSGDWSALFTRLEAPHLEELELAFNQSSPELWLALARNSSLKNLKSLNEYAVTMTRGDLASAVRELAANLTQLEALILPSAAHLDDAAIEPLFAVSSAVQLRRLELGNTMLTDASLRNWARGGRLGRLESFAFRDSRCTPGGITTFFASPMPKLQKLSWNSFDDGAVEALLSTPAVLGLRSLRLGSDKMTDATLKSFARSEQLGELRSLHLTGSFGVLAVIRMLDARNLPKLEAMDLAFDPTRLTHAKLDFLYAALLRFAEFAPLKKFSLPYDDRKSHPLRDRMSQRLSENSSR